MRKLIQRHRRSNWETSSVLETVTQQLLPQWGPLLCRRCHTLHTISLSFPAENQRHSPDPPAKNIGSRELGWKQTPPLHDNTHTWVSMEDLKAHSFLFLTRATSSCFPKHWSVEALKSRDPLKTFLHITLTNNLYFHNRSILFIYQTFSLALLEWSEALGLIKTPLTLMEGFWEAVSGLSHHVGTQRKQCYKASSRGEQIQWMKQMRINTHIQQNHIVLTTISCRANILLPRTSHNYLIVTFS